MSTHQDGLDLDLSATHGDLKSAAGVKKAGSALGFESTRDMLSETSRF